MERKELTQDELDLLIEAVIADNVVSVTPFSKFDITKQLRMENPDKEIVHEMVKDYFSRTAVDGVDVVNAGGFWVFQPAVDFVDLVTLEADEEDELELTVNDRDDLSGSALLGA